MIAFHCLVEIAVVQNTITTDAVIVTGIGLVAEYIDREDFYVKVNGFLYRGRSAVECITIASFASGPDFHLRYVNIETQIVDCLEIVSRFGCGNGFDSLRQDGNQGVRPVSWTAD